MQDSASPTPRSPAQEAAMRSVFCGNTVEQETVMFIDPADEKKLLYPIEQVIAVTSYDGETVYEAGRDYVVSEGNLRLTPHSAIPCITPEAYYDVPASILETAYKGRKVLTHWGEYALMSAWQVCVTYTHDAPWDGFIQPSEAEYFGPFLDKLRRGEDVTVLFYGDSITYGYNASWMGGFAPYRPSYAMLFTRALADRYGYTVRYTSTGIPVAGKIPEEDYVAGSRGVITYLNTAVGGWTAEGGVAHRQAHLADQVAAHGCDLLVLAFGMNDGGKDPQEVAQCLSILVDCAREQAPEVAVALVATMVPNPNATNGWYGRQAEQEPALLALAEDYRAKGVPCGVCRMTSVSLSVLTRKDFHDYSGNNINHPNDFFSRVYAQTLLRTVDGA